MMESSKLVPDTFVRTAVALDALLYALERPTTLESAAVTRPMCAVSRLITRPPCFAWQRLAPAVRHWSPRVRKHICQLTVQSMPA